MAAFFLILASNTYGADYLTGHLIDNADGSFDIYSSNGRFQIKTNDKILNSLPSLANPNFVKQSNGNPYSYEFKGKIQGNIFNLIQTPSNIAGAELLNGVLVYDKTSNKYFINNQEVSFGYTKKLNNYQFDELSKQSFVGKKVLAEGDFESGVFIIQALIPLELFNAKWPKKSRYSIAIQKNPLKFINRDVYKNKISKSDESFREVIYNKPGSEINPGESVFILTLSGRQGDTFDSVNGHFVAGVGEVKKDLSLRVEMSNAYVVNGKDILSGNSSLINYFANLVQGQNQYRPTYTLIVYGIDKSKLKQFRESMEPAHIKFRTSDQKLTIAFNCTTETIKSLNSVGIIASHGLNRLTQSDAQNKELLEIIHEVSGRYPHLATETLTHLITKDKKDYQPRPAFTSYVKSLTSEKIINKLGIKRIDYAFYPQIQSKRPIGGAPVNKVVELSNDSSLYFYILNHLFEDVPDNQKPSQEKFLELLKKLDHIQ